MAVIKVMIREAMQQYSLEMDSLSYAESSRRVYGAKLRRFVEIYERYQRERRHVPYVSSIDPGVIAAYFASYGSPYSRNDALKTIRGFMKWAVRMRYITGEDAAAAVDRRMAPVTRRPKLYLTADQFPLALDIAEQRHPQERVVAALAIFTLCRVSEVTFIKLKHVNLHKGELTIWRLKRKRWTTVVISPDLREELDSWLAWYATAMGYQSPAVMMAEHPDWYLTPRVTFRTTRNPSGQFVSDDSEQGHVWPEKRPYRLELVVKNILNGLGVQGEQGSQRKNLGEGMHMFRRSAARALLLHLTDVVGDQRALLQVSKMLDHEDIKQTLRYIGMDLEKQELDNYLRTNRMFGDMGRPKGAPGLATVVPIGARSKGSDATNAPTPHEGVGAGVQGL